MSVKTRVNLQNGVLGNYLRNTPPYKESILKGIEDARIGEITGKNCVRCISTVLGRKTTRNAEAQFRIDFFVTFSCVPCQSLR